MHVRLVGVVLLTVVMVAAAAGPSSAQARGQDQERRDATAAECVSPAMQDGPKGESPFLRSDISLKDLIAAAEALVEKAKAMLTKAEEDEKNAKTEEEKKKAQRKKNVIKRTIDKAKSALRRLSKNFMGNAEVTQQAKDDLRQAERDLNRADEIAGARQRLKDHYGLSDKQLDEAKDEIAGHLKDTGRSEPVDRFLYGVAVAKLKSAGKDVCDGPAVAAGILDVWKGEAY